MATAEELLSDVTTVDKTLVISNDLRTISIPSSVPNLGVESDDEVLRLSFKMPRYTGDIDLSTFAIRINYLNARGEGDIYEVEDSSADSDYISFTWLVGPTATRYRGATKFNVCLKTLTQDGFVDKEFNTVPASLDVLEGLEVDKTLAEKYPDILEQWRREICPLTKGKSVDSVVQTSTTGNDNVAYSPAGAAFGVNTVAGIKGFRMTDVVVGEDGKITITVDDANLTDKVLTSYAVGDILQLDAEQNHYFRLEIVELKESAIIVEQTIDKELDFTLSTNPEENYCWVVGKYYGDIFPYMARAAHSEGEETLALGTCAHAEGGSSKAIGNYSHAEGMETLASYCAHAEGKRTEALGYHSHAEGVRTEAIGQSAHAEGHESKAFGEASHAEGLRSEAHGMYSHAEGNGTKAIKSNTHAEGMSTEARAIASHAEGNKSKTLGDYSHAEGQSTVATGAAAHAEGFATNAQGSNSHAEGDGTIANTRAHSEGYETKALGTNSHAEGRKSVTGAYLKDADGNYLDADGKITEDSSKYVADTSKGESAHAEGYNTRATGNSAHSEGKTTSASGDHSHAEGLSTQATVTASHAEGQGTIAKGYASHAEGQGTIANGAGGHVQGRYNVEDKSAKYAHIVGGGSSDSNRKNIHTLDWHGNAYFAGTTLTIGNTTVTETQLQALLALLEAIDSVDKIATTDDVSNAISAAITGAIGGSY